MCTASLNDLEEIPLEEDDSGSVEFQILAYYVKHHVFKNHSTLFSPKRPRTRSLGKGLGSWAASESWPSLPWAARQSSAPEQTISLTKKKSSWRTLFGVAEKEEFQSACEVDSESPKVEKCQTGPQGQQWTRSLSNVEQRVEPKAVDPKVVSVAKRVAEIVNSWPPLENQGPSLGSKGNFLHQVPVNSWPPLENQGPSLGSKGNFLHQVPVNSWPPLENQGPSLGSKGNFLYQVPDIQPQGANTRIRFVGGGKIDIEDHAITRIVELLKYSGDQLERELQRDKNLMHSFQDGLSYSIFKSITDQFLRGVDTRGESEVRAQSFKAALAIDVMTKLTAFDTHPMNRVLGFGTKYLKEHFSPWVQQHGGWEKVFGVSQEEVD